MLSVAKFNSLEEQETVILDNYLPHGKRSTKLVYGRIVSNTFTPPKISTFPGFNMTIQEVPPMNGNGAHIHKNTEIFIFLDGVWEIGFGFDAQEKAILHGGDVIIVPAFECRTYKNISEEPAHICTVLAGESWVQFDRSVVDEARLYGAKCDDWGTLTHDSKGKEIENDLNQDHFTHFRTKDEFVVTPMDEMLRKIHRRPNSNGQQFIDRVPEGMGFKFVNLNAGTSARIPVGALHTTVVAIGGRGLLQGLQVLDRFDTILIERNEGTTENEFRLEGLERENHFLIIYSDGMTREI